MFIYRHNAALANTLRFLHVYWSLLRWVWPLPLAPLPEGDACPYEIRSGLRANSIGDKPSDMHQPKLLIATGNPGKMLEYHDLLRAVPFQLVSLSDMGITDEVEETGVTFHENAALKTSGYAALSGLLTLADDSGLEVDALDGAPGVYSARYGELPDASPQESFATPPYEGGVGRVVAAGTGPDGKMTDEDRVALLLRNLEGVPWERRTAWFR